MNLFHRDLGGAGKPPLIILHGLLGSSRNWQTVGAELSTTYHVCALDLRNHGLSPHAAPHSFEAMEADVLAWLDSRGILTATLLGHSMGGKLAMALACHFPARFDALTVVDMAPKVTLLDRHRPSFDALRAVPLSTLKSRAEAEAFLAHTISDFGLRKFLATNLDRDETGNWIWRVNHAELDRSLETISANSLAPTDRYQGPTFFLLGGRSDYVTPDDYPAIRTHFPAAKIEVLPDAGHNPHIDSRPAFVATLKRLL